MLELPYPPKELSPNVRGHWAKKAKFFKVYKEQVYYLAKSHKPMIKFSITFFPRSILQDRDNAIAAFKAGQDGLALAWGVNDRDFTITYEPITQSVKSGKIILKEL